MVRNYQTHRYGICPHYTLSSLHAICGADRELAISLFRVTHRTAALVVLACICLCFVGFHDLVVHGQQDMPACHVR